MRFFVTGATGFIGSALIPELIGAGHQVLGLTRSEAGEQALRDTGAEALYGNLQDLDSLRKGAETTDGTIHLAFSHDFSQFEQNAADERHAIAAMGEVLLGSRRPLVITSGTALVSNDGGKPSTEDGVISSANPRSGLETVVKSYTDRGVNTSIVRLSQIHDARKQGLVPYLLEVSRAKRISAYIGEGANRWPAAHVSDTARLYRLAAEKAEAGSIYHAVDEEGITMKAIAEAHGRGLGIPVVSIRPEEVEGHFGWLAMFATLDMPSSSELTRRKLSWTPTGPGLLSDLDRMDYSQA